MKNFNNDSNRQNKKAAQENKERGNKMAELKRAELNQTVEKILDRKLSIAYQQNIIEMFGYIYLYPGEHTLYSLAYEMQKDGIANTRKIQRMITDFNALCPCIKGSISEIDNCKHFSILEGFSEQFLDNSYKRLNNASLLYVFLKAFFFQKLSVKDVMANTNVTKRQAIKMINAVLDSTYLIFDNDYEENIEIGNEKFFEELV